jgi:predicted acetyltransferase
MPVITATQDVEIRRILVLDQPGKKKKKDQSSLSTNVYNPSRSRGIGRTMVISGWFRKKKNLPRKIM